SGSDEVSSIHEVSYGERFLGWPWLRLLATQASATQHAGQAFLSQYARPIGIKMFRRASGGQLLFPIMNFLSHGLDAVHLRLCLTVARYTGSQAAGSCPTWATACSAISAISGLPENTSS